jgi:hypothetical protein
MITTRDLDAYYAVIGSAVSTKSLALQSELNNFHSLLWAKLDIYKEASRRIAVFNAPDFSAFDYFGLGENALSNVIAGLLDTEGAHGQGDLFLREFLAMLDLDPPRPERPHKVLTQVPMMGFLDILIDFGNFGIGIENKPWAGEQLKQVERYCTALDQRYSGEFLFVYLSGNDSPPASISEELRKRLERNKKLTTRSYSFLEHWLRRCARMCEADKVRWFLRDLAQYLAGEFTEQGGYDEVE